MHQSVVSSRFALALLACVVAGAAQAATVDELLTGRENLRMIGELYGLDRAAISQRLFAGRQPVADTSPSFGPW